MVQICTEWWCTEANEATQTHCYNPVMPAYPVWAYYAHGWQCRCQEDPVSLPSGRREKTTRLPPHHVAQHHPTGSQQHHLTLPEAADLAQNRPLWRMMSTYGAMQSWVACQKWWRWYTSSKNPDHCYDDISLMLSIPVRLALYSYSISWFIQNLPSPLISYGPFQQKMK